MLVYRLPGAKRIRSASRIALQTASLTWGTSQHSTETRSIGKRRRVIADFLCPLTATPLLYLNTSCPGVGVAGCRQPGVTPMAREIISIPVEIASKPGGRFPTPPVDRNIAAVSIRLPRQCPPGTIIGPSPPGETYLPRDDKRSARGSGQHLRRCCGARRRGLIT